MIDRNEIIEKTSDTEEWDAFSQRIEMLKDKELIAIAYELSVSVGENAQWQDYRDVFCKEYWREFTIAYEKVMGGTY